MWIDPLRARIDSASAEERLFAEFLIEWAQARAALQRALQAAAASPESPEPVHAMFRALHSQKSGLRMLRLDAAAELVHALEDALEPARAGQLRLDAPLESLLNRCVALIERSLHRHGLDVAPYTLELAPVTRALQRLPASGREREAQLELLKLLLDPWSDPAEESTLLADLDTFRRIGAAAELRLQRPADDALWREQIAARLHAASGGSLPTPQVLAAALLWNVGRAQLPVDLRALERPPADEPRRTVWCGHAQVAAAFLQTRSAWNDCARLLALQLEPRAAGGGQAVIETVALLRTVAAWVAAGGRQQISQDALRGAQARLGSAAAGWLDGLLAVLDPP